MLRQFSTWRPCSGEKNEHKYRNEEELLAQQADPKAYNDTVIWPDKVKINLYYLDNWSFFGDIKLIFKTLF